MSTGIAVSGQQALATAERLLDPENVLAAVPASAGASLASGLAGTALLHARLSTTDPVFATAATRHWETCAVHARRYGGNSAGTFSSPGGLAAWARHGRCMTPSTAWPGSAESCSQRSPPDTT